MFLEINYPVMIIFFFLCGLDVVMGIYVASVLVYVIRSMIAGQKLKDEILKEEKSISQSMSDINRAIHKNYEHTMGKQKEFLEDVITNTCQVIENVLPQNELKDNFNKLHSKFDRISQMNENDQISLNKKLDVLNDNIFKIKARMDIKTKYLHEVGVQTDISSKVVASLAKYHNTNFRVKRNSSFDSSDVHNRHVYTIIRKILMEFRNDCDGLNSKRTGEGDFVKVCNTLREQITNASVYVRNQMKKSFRETNECYAAVMRCMSKLHDITVQKVLEPLDQNTDCVYYIYLRQEKIAKDTYSKIDLLSDTIQTILNNISDLRKQSDDILDKTNFLMQVMNANKLTLLNNNWEEVMDGTEKNDSNSLVSSIISFKDNFLKIQDKSTEIDNNKQEE